MSKIRIQKTPNFIPQENRICLTRIRWETRTRLGRLSCSNKLSVSIILEPRDMWVGAFFNENNVSERVLYVCLIPCLPIRFKWVRSWGGIYP